MQSDTLEERYATWIEYNFLSDIEDSRKTGSLWEMMRGVGGVRKSEHQSWLAKGLGLLRWGFKGVQEEIPGEEARNGSVAFPLGQCTSPQLHPFFTDYLTKIDIKTIPQPPHSPGFAPCDIWLFHKLRSCRYETIEEIKEDMTKVIDTLTQEDFHGA